MNALLLELSRFSQPANENGYRRGGGQRIAQGVLLMLTGWAAFFAPSQAQSGEFPEFTVASSRDYLQAVMETVRLQAADREGIHLILARLQMQLGLKAEAEKTARLGLAKNPKQPELLLFLANSLIKRERLSEARPLLAQACVQTPANIAPRILLGMLLDRLGDRKSARRVYLAAAQIAPGDHRPFLLLGQSLAKEGLFKDALGHLEKACSLAPKETTVHYTLWRVQMQLGQEEAAEQSLAAFETLKQSTMKAADKINAERDNEQEMRGLAASFHLKTARFFLDQKDVSTAESHFRQAVEVAPRFAKAHQLLATFYLQRNQPLQAKSSLERLVRLQPNQAGYRADLGALLLQTRNFNAGVKELQQALSLDPDQPQALHNLARFFLGQGRNAAAALSLSHKLVQKNPNARNYDLFAWACYANGRIAEAKSAAAAAVRYAPDNPAYKTRLQQLERLPLK